jgi:hypothetical protein
MHKDNTFQQFSDSICYELSDESDGIHFSDVRQKSMNSHPSHSDIAQQYIRVYSPPSSSFTFLTNHSRLNPRAPNMSGHLIISAGKTLPTWVSQLATWWAKIGAKETRKSIYTSLKDRAISPVTLTSSAFSFTTSKGVKQNEFVSLRL